MAVDAVVLAFLVSVVILVNDGLVKVGEIALVKAQLAVKLVGGFNETVGEVGVNIFLCHTELVGGMLKPLAIFLSIYGHAEFTALVVSQQTTPFNAVKGQFTIAAGSGQHRCAFPINTGHKLLTFAFYHYVKGSNVAAPQCHDSRGKC